MKLVVLSGKGGTGKSTITSSLALAFARKKKLVLVDADCDCPNLSLLFPGNLILKKKQHITKIAQIDYNKCKHCLACVPVCQFSAVEVVDKKPKISKFGCEGCGACVFTCPHNAIKLVPKLTGELLLSETKHFPLVHSQLTPGESGSGRLVYAIHSLADKVAQEKEMDLVIVDAPAGIGCPVIAAVSGCDYAIGVVEPTPASLANLERALAVVEYFNIPYCVVLNKAGISPKHEKLIAEKFGDKLIAQVPYDKEVPLLLAQGTPPILGKGKAAEKLEMLVENVKKILDID